MNIQTVATNLRNTIAGKEKHLVSLNSVLAGHHLTATERTVCATTAKFLEVNLDELKRILKDVESCVAKDVEQSWRDNPDRSGGQFTQEEIDNANRW
jgi:hypothetical protein